jgi:Uncharacterized conserved protein (DUF2278)
MLPSYGVVVGDYVNFTREQGQWLHVLMNIQAGNQTYQGAVDVNELQGSFQYQIVGGLDQSLFAPILALSDGWHLLASNPTSGAVDYARSPILQKGLGCLAVIWTVFNSIFKTSGQVWNNVTGDDAGNALVAMLTPDTSVNKNAKTKVFVFGAPYTDGTLGVHDVHCNQGDPPGQFRHLDGIWQDGCCFAILADGSLSAYLGKFSTQSLHTDNNGLPI